MALYATTYRSRNPETKKMSISIRKISTPRAPVDVCFAETRGMIHIPEYIISPRTVRMVILIKEGGLSNIIKQK